VHDITDLEGRGVPGVFVASTEFADAADAQARALGFDPARVLVAHPIQDRTDEELAALADAAVEEIVAALLASGVAQGRPDPPE
jgi:alkanesulfonate monooxygenase SsuD/methylene tetrahydromethanopterin reductase-like flavin-dependent oxidoreductase (luciferase family)